MRPGPRSRPLAIAALTALALLPAAARAQFVDDHFEPLLTPPPAGAYAPDAQQATEEGFQQLERVEGPQDEATLEAAKAAFERALDVESKNAHAHNGRGVYELKKDEGWLILLESLKKIFNRDHISMAIKAFERALEIEPAFHPARYNLALAYRQARGAENWTRAAAELERLVAEAPETGQTPLLLVLTYRDLGHLDKLERALETLPETASFPASLRALLLAYTRINDGRPAEGARSYWDGVAAIASPDEADLFWHDIRPIATAEEDAAFAALDVDARKAYLRELWQRLGDEGFTSADDRLAEHYRRLDFVYRNYRLALPERRHYSSVAAYVPSRQTGFDDRGVIYLRHGPPDDEATYSGPEVERNVSWKYERAGGNPLVFHFVSDEDVSDFKLVRTLQDALLTNNTGMQGTTLLDPHAATNAATRGARFVHRDDRRILATERRALQDLYSSRGSLDPMYDRAALDLDPQLLQSEESILARSIEVGTGTRSFAQKPPESPLPFAVQAVPFRGPDGKPVVQFYYAVPTSQLSIVPRADGGSDIDYDYRLNVRAASEGAVVERRGQPVHITTRRPVPRDRGVMLPAVESVSLPAGSFVYGMKLQDMTSGRFGILEGTLAVDDFASRGLSLSGLLLASSIEPARDPADPFARGALRVLPLPSHVFRRSQPVHVYYEVYGLDAAADGSIRFRTTYTLTASDRGRNVVAKLFSAVGELLARARERGGITYEFERGEAGRQDPLVDHFSLDVTESPRGEYTLIVEVEDLVSGDETRREAPLTLVD